MPKVVRQATPVLLKDSIDHIGILLEYGISYTILGFHKVWYIMYCIGSVVGDIFIYRYTFL